MRDHFFFFALLFMMLFSACSTEIESNGDIELKPEATTEIPIQTEESIEPTSTAVSIPLLSSAWKMVWANDFQNNGRLRAIKQGTNNGIWLLYDEALIWLPTQGEAERFSLKEILGCVECRDEINGTLAVAQVDDAWVGLSSGLLVAKKTGEWFRLSSEDIIHTERDAEEIRVLLFDQHKEVWVNFANILCKSNGDGWNCETFDELVVDSFFGAIDDIISATPGKDDQIWFGTRFGKIILYNSNIYIIDDLPGFLKIGDMAYNPKTETLWAINVYPPSCGEGVLSDSIGVYYKRDGNEWGSFPLSLFADCEGNLCYFPLTSIDVTTEGVVWLGMMFRHGLVYYDGIQWKTLEGETLPTYFDSCLDWSNECGVPDCYTVDVLATHDGRLLVANRDGVFEYIGSSNTN